MDIGARAKLVVAGAGIRGHVQTPLTALRARRGGGPRTTAGVMVTAAFNGQLATGTWQVSITGNDPDPGSVNDPLTLIAWV
jgi:hypothetical protein